jgi:hypothetical protein
MQSSIFMLAIPATHGILLFLLYAGKICGMPVHDFEVLVQPHGALRGLGIHPFFDVPLLVFPFGHKSSLLTVASRYCLSQ